MHRAVSDRLRSRRLPLGWSCAILLAAAACDGPSEPDPPPVPTALTVVAGEGQADTVDALAAQRLEIVVTDDRGGPSPGIAVEFAGDLAAGSASEPGVLVGTAATGFQRTVSATTDASGKAWVNVTMGRVAGTTRVVVTAPALGLADTAAFTVRPGTAVRLAVAPRDTGVYVDGSFALRVQAADRWQNAVPDQLSYVARGPVVTVAAGTVSGAATGRTHVVVQAGAFRDSTAVTVVPRGVLVARRSSSGLQNGLVSLGLDGSQFRVLTSDWAYTPRFLRDGSIVFANGEPGELQRVTTDGTVQPFLAGGSGIPGASWPHPSPDGEWIYFTQFDQFHSRATPMRVRRDGSVLEPVPGFEQYPNRGHFSLSPDGTHLTYYAELNFDSRNVAVRVSRIGSGDVLAQTPGHGPEWSPTGEWIAYLLTNGQASGPLRLMRPDGTGIRTVGNAAQSYEFGIDWSPDGKWLVAATSKGLELVNVEMGQVLPLPGYAAGLLQPSWKR
jgi:hypothetical protein